MSNSNNLGQVVGLYVGTTPPENTLLIWYDSTPTQRCHKIYDPTTKLWDALNPEVVTNITYSEITNAAKNNGLPIGKYYRITDRSNVLAIAITTTKIQYTDTLGNILVDDLGVNIQYHVTSSNLLIDDIQGVFNTNTRKLVFTFADSTPNFDTDYIFGKKKEGNAWKLAKFLWKSLVSKVTGNSLSWNGGLFFDFNKSLKNSQDKEGGVVSMSKYSSDHKTITENINNISKQNQTIIQNANNSITTATTDNAIYNKKFPSSPSTSGVPGDLVKGQTLLTIINNVYRWINRVRWATGVTVSQSFKDVQTAQFINNNDSVETALGKVQYYLKKYKFATGIILSDEYNPEKYDEEIKEPIAKGDSIEAVIEKIDHNSLVNYTTLYTLITKNKQDIQKNSKLKEDWVPKDVTTNIAMPIAGDTLDEAFAKAIGKLNQLGEIYNGGFRSKGTVVFNGTTQRRGNIDIENFYLNGYNSNGSVYISPSTLELFNTQGNGLDITPSVFQYKSSSLGNYITEVQGFATTIFRNTVQSESFNSALTAVSSDAGKNTFDAAFARLHVGNITFTTTFVDTTTYSVGRAGLIIVNSATACDIYLPSSPSSGLLILIALSSTAGANIHAQGGNQIDTINESAAMVTINERGAVFAFIYVNGISYAGTNVNGLWQYAKWSKTNS